MPFIGYAQLGEIVGKTEEQVREDKKTKSFDLDNFESLIKYAATELGWTPPGQAPAVAPRVVSKVTDNVEPTLDPYLERVKQQRGEPPTTRR